MNAQQDHELARKIVGLLSQGAREMDAATAAKLLQVRKEALAHFQQRPAHAWVPEWAGAAAGRLGLDRFSEPFSYNLRAGFVLLALLTSLAGVVTWQTFSQQGSDIADIDEGLLTGELPINAYLDKGFDSWLKRP